MFPGIDQEASCHIGKAFMNLLNSYPVPGLKFLYNSRVNFQIIHIYIDEISEFVYTGCYQLVDSRIYITQLQVKTSYLSEVDIT